jgi:hypothetical protein
VMVAKRFFIIWTRSDSQELRVMERKKRDGGWIGGLVDC